MAEIVCKIYLKFTHIMHHQHTETRTSLIPLTLQGHTPHAPDNLHVPCTHSNYTYHTHSACHTHPTHMSHIEHTSTPWTHTHTVHTIYTYHTHLIYVLHAHPCTTHMCTVYMYVHAYYTTHTPQMYTYTHFFAGCYQEPLRCHLHSTLWEAGLCNLVKDPSSHVKEMEKCVRKNKEIKKQMTNTAAMYVPLDQYTTWLHGRPHGIPNGALGKMSNSRSHSRSLKSEILGWEGRALVLSILKSTHSLGPAWGHSS